MFSRPLRGTAMPGVEMRVQTTTRTRGGKGHLGANLAKGKAKGLQHRAPSRPRRRGKGDSVFVDRLDDFMTSKLRRWH